MKKAFPGILTLLALIAISVFSSCTQVNPEEEKQALTELLNEFLTKVNEYEMHDRFWADDLVYTGSAGTRHGKKLIMDGMQESESDTSESMNPHYSYDNLKVKVFGKTAAITFQLIAETPGDTLHYLNSGFFEKRDGQWKAVVWQATRMEESSGD